MYYAPAEASLAQRQMDGFQVRGFLVSFVQQLMSSASRQLTSTSPNVVNTTEHRLCFLDAPYRFTTMDAVHFHYAQLPIALCSTFLYVVCKFSAQNTTKILIYAHLTDAVTSHDRELRRDIFFQVLRPVSDLSMRMHPPIYSIAHLETGRWSTKSSESETSVALTWSLHTPMLTPHTSSASAPPSPPRTRPLRPTCTCALPSIGDLRNAAPPHLTADSN